MKNAKSPDDTVPKEQPLDLTWPVVFSVTGLTLLRSKSVVCQTLGATLTTLSLIRLIKNSPPLPENSLSGKRSISAPKTQSLKKYRGWLQRAAINGLCAVAEDTLNDDVFVLSVCSKVYRHLPLPIQRIATCEWCLRYLQYGKPMILRRIQRLRAYSDNSPALPDDKAAGQQEQTPPQH
ncbi:hypothetical protein [Enterobacter hormaechei]|uniref:hypothetical protein n=1 Tax=Enterobacter hormaechei TaxID=158836 RepID=UPI001D113746|nr:hypothetical protein [Enterobacter hormaechei]MCC2894764.1 hypothetical protein [Enterobacter hormaechei]UDV67531.1 hypothetical protein LJU36_20090 [Enterobacter hormaechei]